MMKRKRLYLINRDFQLRYTWAAVVVGLLSTGFTAFVLLYPLYQFEILRIPVFVPLKVMAAMALASAVNIFFVASMGILITHKIAGPMYSLVRHFRRIEEGQWHGPMRLRDGDELRYLVRNFNEMLNGLIRMGREDKAIMERLYSNLNEIDANLESRALAEQLIQRFELRLNSDRPPESQV